MSHNQTLGALLFRKPATPTSLGVGRLVSLQAGASQGILPFTVYAMLTVTIPVVDCCHNQTNPLPKPELGRLSDGKGV